MARSLRRKKALSSAAERFSDTPAVTIYKTAEEAGPQAAQRAAAKTLQQSRPRPSSKVGIVLALLEGPDGASLARLVEVTGWQAHTTRAALTGLRKRGYTITSEKVVSAEGSKSSMYRIQPGEAP